MNGGCFDDGRRFGVIVVDAEVGVGHQQSHVLLDVLSPRQVADVEHVTGQLIDAWQHEPIAEGHGDYSGQSVDCPLQQGHPIGEVVDDEREVVKGHRIAQSFKGPHRRDDAGHVNERRLEVGNQRQSALVQHSLHHQQIEVLAAVHQLKDGRIRVAQLAQSRHSSRELQHQQQRHVHVESDLFK